MANPTYTSNVWYPIKVHKIYYITYNLQSSYAVLKIVILDWNEICIYFNKNYFETYQFWPWNLNFLDLTKIKMKWHSREKNWLTVIARAYRQWWKLGRYIIELIGKSYLSSAGPGRCPQVLSCSQNTLTKYCLICSNQSCHQLDQRSRCPI